MHYPHKSSHKKRAKKSGFRTRMKNRQQWPQDH